MGTQNQFSSNFLQETLEILTANGKTPADVSWVGEEDDRYCISWEQFMAIADFDYNNVEGGSDIATDIVVVGHDWWLERHDAEGAEWWEYKTLPRPKQEAKPFANLRASVPEMKWFSLRAVN